VSVDDVYYVTARRRAALEHQGLVEPEDRVAVRIDRAMDRIESSAGADGLERVTRGLWQCGGGSGEGEM